MAIDETALEMDATAEEMDMRPLLRHDTLLLTEVPGLRSRQINLGKMKKGTIYVTPLRNQFLLPLTRMDCAGRRSKPESECIPSLVEMSITVSAERRILLDSGMALPP